jgi:uncharacterized protein YbjT (DUF2867 family)
MAMEYYQTAIVFGATGLVGRQLVFELIQHSEYARVKVFTRRKLDFEHPKVHEVITDFMDWDAISKSMTGEVVFCCIGTTQKKAGSKEAFRKIDYDLVVKIAELTQKNEIGKFVVISSVGAKNDSSNFYLKVKGEMEEKIKSIPIEKKIIVRPSMLLGNRKEFRLSEVFGKILFFLFGFLFVGRFKKYKAISDVQVAKAMIKLIERKDDKIVFESDELLYYS